ncbi:MAG: sigma-70 family RNA polymerase sigma factor [Planctomycetota bacterium]
MNVASVLVENEGWLRAVVFSRLGDRLATEDVLQEICIAALISDSKKQEILEPKGWLYQVAIKQVLLFRRSECRQRQKLQRFSELVRQPGFEHREDELAKAESQGMVREALEQIRPSDRQVLVMKYTEGMSCKQIAEHLGVTESTIQSRLLRARRRLRQTLVSQGSLEGLIDAIQ